jgi:DNA-binding CsgD family transcriptional regulator/tetratricopeptide (TPR) repeat protein
MPQQDVIPLQGRDNELHELIDHLGPARRGTVAAALLSGEPGIGKTRLLTEVSARLEDEGFQTRHGSGEELAVLRPLGPVLDALGLEPDPPRAQEPPESWRYRMFERAIEATETAADERPLLLVLDDLQWADRTTLSFLRALCTRAIGSPVAVLGAHRPVPGDHTFANALGSVIEAGALRLVLEPLSASAVESLAEALLEAPPGDAVLRWAQSAGGNPLYVCELLRSAAENGRVSVVNRRADLTAEALPRALSVLLERRVASLSPEAGQVLNVASVIGDGFAPHLLAEVMRRSTASVLPMLEEAFEAGILTVNGDRAAFRHDLIREAVYRRIASPLRASLHIEAARTLLSGGGQPGIVAAHLMRGGPAPELIPMLREAAAQLAPTAPGPAAELLQRALELMPAADVHRGELEIALVRLLAWSGRAEEAAARADALLQAGIDQQVEAQLRVGLAEAMIFRGLPHGVLEQLERARRLPTITDHELAPLLAAASHARLFTGEIQHVEQQAAEAVRVADRAGDEASACFALLAAAIRRRNEGRLDASLAAAQEAVRRADNGPLEARHRQPRLFLAPTLFSLGAVEEADQAYLTGRASAEVLGSTWALAPYSAFRAIHLRWTGRWDEAVAEAEASLDLAEELDQPNVAPMACAVLADIYAHKNAFETARGYLARGEELVRSGVRWTAQFLVWAAATFADASGDPAGAIRILIDGGLDKEILGLVIMENGPAPQMIRMLCAGGEQPRARVMLSLIERISRENPHVPALRAAALHSKGLLTGDGSFIAEAADLLEPTPFVPAHAFACEDAGVLLGNAARAASASELLRRAWEQQSTLRAELDMARIEGHLRRLGISRRGRRRKPTEDALGWPSLTPAEARIAQLVAEGLSNPQIAARLVISRHTVESHLKRVFAKLGIGSRVELAKIALQNPTKDP